MRLPLCFVFLTAGMFGQTFTNASLTGKYFVRHIEFTTDASNNATDARSILGAITFNGTGNYSFTGQQAVGTGGAASLTVSGTYAVTSGGNVTLTNPQNGALTVNARIGAEALVGSSTEAAGNIFDLFIAIPAPVATQSNASIGGGWQATDFELTGASTAQVRDSLVAMTFDGAGNVANVNLSGHAANFGGGSTFTQSISGATYSVAGDGTGTVTFPLPGGVSGAGAVLSSAARTLYVSQTGHLLLAGTPGGHDILIAVRASASSVSLTGRYWSAGIRVDSTGSSNSYTGSGTVITPDKALISTHRLHVSGNGTPINLTAAASYTVAADGTGSIGPTRLAVGAGGLVMANVGNVADPSGYEIGFSEAIPAVTGSGVFVNPQGVVNAASNAPAGDAISPGEFIAIYGSGLSTQTTSSVPPYPATLANVSVSIGGLPAPVYLVSPGQINCLVPYKIDVTKPSANIIVTSNGAVSNTVAVPVAKTSPGVFSNDLSGTGDGAIVHLDATLVTAANPATKGETLTIYLTGLGPLQNPVTDGAAPNPPAADSATSQVVVFVNGVAVPSLLYSGLNPVFPGLYQINFKVPTNIGVSGELPVAIQTPDAFHDQINLAVQ